LGFDWCLPWFYDTDHYFNHRQVFLED
jgi:hypothetical protein